MICDDGRIAANNGKQSPGPEAFLCGCDQENCDWMSYVSEEALERGGLGIGDFTAVGTGTVSIVEFGATAFFHNGTGGIYFWPEGCIKS